MVDRKRRDSTAEVCDSDIWLDNRTRLAANGAALSASSAAESAASGQAVACIGNAASGRGEIAVEKEGLVKIFPPAQIKTPSWQISLASLGIAAAQFARCGFDVSIQYGADKPAHDLVITKGSNLLKVVVKGSQDGLWDLTQSYIRRAAQISGKKADYYGAIGMWLDHHSSRTVCCLVQFQGVTMDELPRFISPRLARWLRGCGKLRRGAETRCFTREFKKHRTRTVPGNSKVYRLPGDFHWIGSKS